MPPGRSSFASRSMMLKKLENKVGTRTHPCLTSLEMGKLPDSDHLCFILPCWPSWSWRKMVRNFRGQSRRARVFHSPSRLTASKALVRSRKTMDPRYVLCISPVSVSARKSCMWSLCWIWTHTSFLMCFLVLSSGWTYSARREARFCLHWRIGWWLASLNNGFSPFFLLRDNDCITADEQILELIDHCFSPVLIYFLWDAINARWLAHLQLHCGFRDLFTSG